MSLLINGELRPGWLEEETEDGEFIRQDSQFRSWITADGAAGPTGDSGFTAEAGRYHLYVCLACPWAHRTLIFRCLKGLDDLISVSVVNPFMLEQGWSFHAYPGSTEDHINGFGYLHQAYTLAQPDYTGIITVPVLWDKKTQTIVNNESSEIIRMFNSAFDDLTGNQQDYYPLALREEIDRINARIYESVNNGVYRSGFATTQEAYERAFDALFASLDWLEDLLAQRRYLAGDVVTESDWRLFTTLVRFDAVYFGHFKCNQRRIVDYPNLWAYTRDLYQVPGIAETVNMQQIKTHYYASHDSINPTGIVPKGPLIDFYAPHGRG
ncbi:putative glutathione S-transferase [Ectothiorhodosinus mongolicus]|uniref:Putative glutathione S-transferase n=1 Tax=Ectothiorhodosinus mongolicus TaxID=233100 RepID=A0A1R3VZH2_9GAMM|nr:glutathione S-transferase family protein [Ectothiorhodosinus mongolicus]ULX57258.1 glutathione S-transferase family protein [Ectothiorhodosinus mongolicus]SIT70676.1 putative glutathione S-transferase [Ectothiorhodosinus mongolicus]